MTGRVARGWYPDYEAPPGHQRFWDGEGWTERRSVAPTREPAPVPDRAREEERTSVGSPRRRWPGASISGWVWAAVAATVGIGVAVLVLGDDQIASSGPGTAPPPASSPGPPASEQTEPEPDRPRRTWQVDEAVDSATLRLSNGVEVRLVGITDTCNTAGLAQLVVGERVTLTRRGADRDVEGHLLRYVERDGVDIGLRMIQRGWARAADEPSPRRAIYRRVDARSPDACAALGTP